MRYSPLGAARMANGGRPGGLCRGLTHGVWAFAQHYFLKLGFLDGWPGFVIAFGNFEGTFHKYAKRKELDAGWHAPQDPPLPKAQAKTGGVRPATPILCDRAVP